MHPQPSCPSPGRSLTLHFPRQGGCSGGRKKLVTPRWRRNSLRTAIHFGQDGGQLSANRRSSTPNSPAASSCRLNILTPPRSPCPISHLCILRHGLIACYGLGHLICCFHDAAGRRSRDVKLSGAIAQSIINKACYLSFAPCRGGRSINYKMKNTHPTPPPDGPPRCGCGRRAESALSIGLLWFLT